MKLDTLAELREVAKPENSLFVRSAAMGMIKVVIKSNLSADEMIAEISTILDSTDIVLAEMLERKIGD